MGSSSRKGSRESVQPRAEPGAVPPGPPAALAGFPAARLLRPAGVSKWQITGPHPSRSRRRTAGRCCPTGAPRASSPCSTAMSAATGVLLGRGRRLRPLRQGTGAAPFRFAPGQPRRAAVQRQARNAARPPQTVHQASHLAPVTTEDSAPPTGGSLPTVRSAELGELGQQGQCHFTRSNAGTERSSCSLARQIGLSRTALSRSRSISARARPPAEVGIDPLVQGWIGGLTPVALGRRHLERLPPACHQTPKWRVASSGKGRAGGRTASAK